MKKFIVALGVLIGVVAFAAAESNLIDIIRGPKPQWFQPSIYFGSATDNPVSSTDNAVTGMFSTSSALDVGATDGGTCVRSAAITLTGANLGDPCLLGLPATGSAVVHDGGGAAVGEGVGAFSCFVSAADAVKIEFCNHATTGLQVDPDPKTFDIRVIGN